MNKQKDIEKLEKILSKYITDPNYTEIQKSKISSAYVTIRDNILQIDLHNLKAVMKNGRN
ncbi:MAG TPA: hypothetical protein PKK56_03110 [archaeon]|nr:hypothetical protein [archaeon]